MTLPTNDDFSNRELSIEELEAIAAGSFFGNVWNGIKSEVKAGINWFEHSTTGSQIKGGAIIGLVVGVWSLLAK
jgi:hypothetical protein